MRRKFVLDNFHRASYTTQTSYTTQIKRLRVEAEPNEKSTHANMGEDQNVNTYIK